MDFTFSTERTCQKADEVVDYLRGPRLWVPKIDYPDFDAWAERVHVQLKSGEKRAVLAFSRGSVVGAVIYQRHREKHKALEIKNLTVRPDVRGRFLASFMVRNAEIEGTHDFGTEEVLVDAKANNIAIRSFLHRNGYVPITVADLYHLGSGPDIVYRKFSARRPKHTR